MTNPAHFLLSMVSVARGFYRRVLNSGAFFTRQHLTVDSESSAGTEIDGKAPISQPAERVSFDIDIIATSIGGFTVRNRASGALHVIRFEAVTVGANEVGDAYVLSLPRDLAIMQGMLDAA